MSARAAVGELWRCVLADIDRAGSLAADFSGHRTTPLRRLSNFLTPGVMCVSAHRVSHLLYRRGHERAAAFVSWLNFVVHKAAIAPSARIGPGLYMPHTVGVVFHGTAGRNVTLYYRATVVAGTVRPRRAPSADAPTLGDGVTVGVLATVVGPVTVGHDSLIGARVAVKTDVPPNSVVLDARYARPQPPRPAAVAAPRELATSLTPREVSRV